MPILVVPISHANVQSLRDCMAEVASEKQFLAITQAPSVGHIQRLVSGGLAQGDIHVVALDDARVLGWACLQRGQGAAVAHRADLSMGVRPSHRGEGLGRRMLIACLMAAPANGIRCIELEVRVDNIRARQLYQALGFVVNSRVCDAMIIDGIRYDALRMRLALPAQNACSASMTTA